MNNNHHPLRYFSFSLCELKPMLSCEQIVHGWRQNRGQWDTSHRPARGKCHCWRGIAFFGVQVGLHLFCQYSVFAECLCLYLYLHKSLVGYLLLCAHMRTQSTLFLWTQWRGADHNCGNCGTLGLGIKRKTLSHIIWQSWPITFTALMPFSLM